MKLFLIKIGKAWDVLCRDGIVRGSKRVMFAFLKLFRRVFPGDVLFISNGVGDSARYRTVHMAEMLKKQGVCASVTVQDNPFLPSYAKQFSVFVFHRTLFSRNVEKLLARAKTLGKEIIFETDDLVYDPMFLQHMDYFNQMNVFERKLYENGVGGEILSDPYVKVCTTSTTYLAEKLREKKKQVFVVRNCLSQEDITNAETIMMRKTKRDMFVRLAYFSGTPSHNKDFATITDALLAVMERYPQTKLVLAGPLDADDRLNTVKDRIERVLFSPRRDHFGNIATVDINLAPLEIGNPFCEAKSELKWFEAGLLAIPTVASGTQTFREAITDGVDGFVASTTAEWIEKISRLVEDTTFRQMMGKNARETVLKKYTTEHGDEEYIRYIKSKLARKI